MGNPVAGGVDVGNPGEVRAKVRGSVVDSTGSAKADVRVNLLPIDFNPVADAQADTPWVDTLVDTTDTNGDYLIEGIVDTGYYRVNAAHINDGTRFVTGPIVLNDTVTVQQGVDTATVPVAVQISIPDSLYVQGGYVYVPGTPVKVAIDSPGITIVDSIWPDSVQWIYYSPANDSQIAAMPDSLVSPVDTSQADTTTDTTGTDTTQVDSTPKVVGQLVDPNGTATDSVRVVLLPHNFNPAKSSVVDSFVDTTDGEGKYEFPVPDSGEYVFTAFHLNRSTAVMVPDIEVQHQDSVYLGTDTLRTAGAILARIPDTLFTTKAYLFVPGTEIKQAIDSAGDYPISPVPACTVNLQLYSVMGDSLVPLDSSFQGLAVAPGETTYTDTSTSPEYTWKGTWEPLHGPGGGMVNTVTFDRQGNLYAGTKFGGVFRSADNGESWTQFSWPQITYPPSYSKSVNALAADSSGNLFAATSHVGVIRSLDNGATWSTTQLDSFACHSLTVIPNGHVFSGDGQGRIFRSMDQGGAWERVWTVTSGTDNTVNVLESDPAGKIMVGPASASIYIIFEHDSVYNMTIKPTMMLNGANVQDFAIRTSVDTVFAATQTNGVYRTTDPMNQWDPVNTGLQDLDVRAIALAPNGLLYAGTATKGVFRSADSGATWAAHNSGIDNLKINSLAAKTSGELVAGTNDGIYVTMDNGSNWMPATNGLNSHRIMSLGSGPNALFAGTFGNGILRSTDAGVSWSKVYPTGDFSAIVVTDGGTVFAGGLRSTDNGSNWSPVSGISGYVCSAAEDTKGYLYAGDAQGGVYRSTDDGATWIRVTTFASNFIEAIVVDPNSHVYVGTWSGEGVYRSTDHGETWTNVNAGHNFGSISGMAVNSKGDVFVVTPGNVTRSTDGGGTWQSVHTGEFALSIDPVAVDLQDNVFVTNKAGEVFVSSDNGTTWNKQITGLSNQWVRCFAVSPNGRVYAGSEGGGVFRSAQ